MRMAVSWQTSCATIAKVKQVLYPGFSDHPQHALAKRQMTGFGSMITFETGSFRNAKKMLAKVRVCSSG